MKRKISILLALAMTLAMLGGCSGGKPAETTAAPAKPAETEAPTEAETEPPRPPFQSYEYEYGSMTIGVPWNLPDEPSIVEDDSITFEDPEGKWSVQFGPLTVENTPLQTRNYLGLMENFKTMGNYRNVETGETTIGGYNTTWVSWEMTPDWDEPSQGYTTSFKEPHKIYIVDYGDAVVGQWGGLIINVAAPLKERVELASITEDEDVKTLVENITFHESDAMPAVSIPGLSVSFPGRWGTGSNGDNTLWASMRGSTPGSIYFGSSIYKDPQEAAGFVSDDVRELEFGGRKWYGGVRTSELSGTTMKSLELFTDFTEYHALYSRLNLNSWESDEDFWNYAESDTFKAVMASVETDPENFHNPENDMKDNSGFECNNINEISAYNGTETEIVIPATVGINDIYGINTRVFAGNEDITSVTISEGITYIEGEAFKDCTNLKTVELPNSLVLIDYRAFEGCTSLENVRFGENLTTIEDSAFENCSSLYEVILPDTVSFIGSSAFAGSGTGEGRFECPAAGTVYEHLAFAEASYDYVSFGPAADLTDYNIMQGFHGRSVNIGEGTETLGEYFLMDPYAQDTQLESVSLPDNMKLIGKSAFQGRKGLTSINLTGLQEMGEGAFCECGLVDIVVPGSLKMIPKDAFNFCPNVETITIEEGVEVICEGAFSTIGIDGKLMTGTYNFLSDEDVEAHRDVVHVDDPAYVRFYDIALPSTIREVEEDAFLATRLEGLYLDWLESVDQLPAEFHPGFDSYECIYVPQATFDAIGDELNAYFKQDEGFKYWAGSVRVYDGRHHYWTDEELGLDA